MSEVQKYMVKLAQKVKANNVLDGSAVCVAVSTAIRSECFHADTYHVKRRPKFFEIQTYMVKMAKKMNSAEVR